MAIKVSKPTKTHNIGTNSKAGRQVALVQNRLKI